MWKTKCTSNTIRDPNPCQNCTREEKKPGCHDICQVRKDWRNELDRINENRKAYEIRMGYR